MRLVKLNQGRFEEKWGICWERHRPFRLARHPVSRFTRHGSPGGGGSVASSSWTRRSSPRLPSTSRELGDRSHGAGSKSTAGSSGAKPVRGRMQGQHAPSIRSMCGALMCCRLPRPSTAGSSGFSGWVPIDPIEEIGSSTSSHPGNRRCRHVRRDPGRVVEAPDVQVLATGRSPRRISSSSARNAAARRRSTPTWAPIHKYDPVGEGAAFHHRPLRTGARLVPGAVSGRLARDVITGEATPYALFHPLAPRRLREIAPAARLIALLRNPIDRAYSQYLPGAVSAVDETLDFAAALDAEQTRLEGEEARLARDPPTRALLTSTPATWRGVITHGSSSAGSPSSQESRFSSAAEDLYEDLRRRSLRWRNSWESSPRRRPRSRAQPDLRSSPRSRNPRPVIAALYPVECPLGRSAWLGPRVGTNRSGASASNPLTCLSSVCHGCRV